MGNVKDIDVALSADTTDNTDKEGFPIQIKIFSLMKREIRLWKFS